MVVVKKDSPELWSQVMRVMMIVQVITKDCLDELGGNTSISLSHQKTQCLRAWVKYIYNLMVQECNVWTELRYAIPRILPVFSDYIANPLHFEGVERPNRKLLKITAPYVYALIRNLFHHTLSFNEIEKQVQEFVPLFVSRMIHFIMKHVLRRNWRFSQPIFTIHLISCNDFSTAFSNTGRR